MGLSQENFDRARESTRPTLEAMLSRGRIDLSEHHVRRLETWAWDLGLIQQALQMEIAGRYGGQVDLGT